MVPPDPHIFTITRNGVNFQSAAELLKMNETSRTVYMALVSPKETQWRTENLPIPKTHFSEYTQSGKNQGASGTIKVLKKNF